MSHVDKDALKARMLKLEQEELDHAIEHYEAYLKDAKLDTREAHDRDEYALSRMNADLAHAFDHPVHDHQAKIEVLEDMDFGPKDSVEQGAVISFNNRHFVVAVSTKRFSLEGQDFMGISLDSPLFRKINGLAEGDTFELNGAELELEEVY